MYKFEPGAVIVDCLPLVHSLSEKEKGKRCNFCLKESSQLKKCSKCKCVFYCGGHCQMNDWRTYHKFHECEIFSRCQEKSINLLDCDRLLLRLFLRVKYDRDSEDFSAKMYHGRTRTFDDLMDNLPHLRKDEPRMVAFYQILSRLKDAQVPAILDQTPELFQMFARICINSFSILDISLNEVASGLYIAGSTFDHSCLPNAAPVFDGRRLQIRAMRPISENEPIYINYIDLKLSRETRRNQLRNQYYFQCDCPKCNSTATDGPGGDEEPLSKQIKTLDTSFDKIIHQSSKWSDAYLVGIRSLPLYERVYRGHHPDFTIQLFRVVKVRLLLDDKALVKLAIDGHQHGLDFLLTKLIESLKITHGADHNLFKEFQSMIHFS